MRILADDPQNPHNQVPDFSKKATAPIGEDPHADYWNGEYLIVKPTSWSQERWDDYGRRLETAYQEGKS